MADTYHLDFETYSEVDLKKVQAFRYASDPSTKILVMAIAKNDGPVQAWDVLNKDQEALDLLQHAVNSGATIYAHNAQFEHAVCSYLLEKTFAIRPPKVEQWRCTAAMCRLAAIPSSLEDAGEFLDIEMPKDKEGKRLIQKFSVPRKPTKRDPRPRIMPEDDPEDLARFVDYCRRDVEAERQIHAKLEKDFPLEGWSLDSFRLDMEMNTNGIPVNINALVHANALMEEYLAKLVPVFRKQVADPDTSICLPVTKQRKQEKWVNITKGFNPSQREMFMVWLADEGFTGDNLQADTQEDWLTNWSEYGLTERGREALHTYSLVSSAAVKKIPAMLSMACSDGYVRGGLQVFGAERTHRWAGRGIQPQNFARPRIKFTELAYDMLRNRATLDEIEDVCGDFFDVLVSVIRHFIQPHDGKVLQADYSAIEARVAPWLVGEERKLEAFRRGDPIYEMMAVRIFGGRVEDITQDQRFIGKQAELGCTYNMGAPKFRGTCEGYGFEPSQEMVEEYKSRHRGVIQSSFAKLKVSKLREIEKRSKKIFDKLTDMRLMQMLIKERGWGSAVLGANSLTPETIMEPTNDIQWLHLTYDDLAERAVTAWREANPTIAQSWRDLDNAAKWCINNPNEAKTVGKLKLIYEEVAGFDALLLKLPSGHKLVYPRARVVERKEWGTEVQFWGIVPNTGGAKWGWCSTYGGKLLENATQATAGDVMREGLKAAWAAGYKAFMLVHDEALTIKQLGQTHEELCRLLCTEAKWMEGLPLAAEGSTIPFYKK